MLLFAEASYFILYRTACSPAPLKRFLFIEIVQMTLGNDDGENIKQKQEAISFMGRMMPRLRFPRVQPDKRPKAHENLTNSLGL